MKSYGELPEAIKEIEIVGKEMMFYQYLPIKLIGMPRIILESHLQSLEPMINECIADFRTNFGVIKFIESFIYLTVKRQYQTKNQSFNREGYHSDGFLTNDINYIWSDKHPTIFNCSKFELTTDDHLSLKEMEEQALPENDIIFPDCTILRLDEYNIHKVNDRDDFEGMRTFVKVSFSKDKYDLEGNSHNYELDYEWQMKPRKKERNIPQSTL